MGLRVRARAGSKAAPATLKSVWQAGEIYGRLEGIAATVPNMTRLWLDRSLAQVRGQAATRGAKAAVRTSPVEIARLRALALIGRSSQPAPATRWRIPLTDQMSVLAQRAATARALNESIASLNRLNTRVLVASAQANKNVRLAVNAVRLPRFTWPSWTLARRTTDTGRLQGTQRQLLRSWSWVRLFALGFALGAIWAYLFAPRRISRQDQTRTEDQSSTIAQPSEQSAAQI
jgi:hypothetical protein